MRMFSFYSISYEKLTPKRHTKTRAKWELKGMTESERQLKWGEKVAAAKSSNDRWLGEKWAAQELSSSTMGPRTGTIKSHTV